jgi:uncharacterized protein
VTTTAIAPPGEKSIPLGVAVLTWLASWLAGNLLAAVAIGSSGERTGDADTPVWLTLVAALSLWIPMVVALREASVRFGAGTFREDYGLRVRPIDALGLPIGVACQLLLVPLLYWPLREAWPATFDDEKLEENARALVDSADGVWMVVLVLIVVAGAPIVEELVYRGLLQGAFTRHVDDVLAVLAVAAWFALVHFRPVEYPGLFLFGLVLGVCAWRTRRIGMAIAAHVGFNATGLALVA